MKSPPKSHRAKTAARSATLRFGGASVFSTATAFIQGRSLRFGGGLAHCAAHALANFKREAVIGPVRDATRINEQLLIRDARLTEEGRGALAVLTLGAPTAIDHDSLGVLA